VHDIDQRTGRGRDRLLGGLAALVSCGLLVFNTASRRSESDLSKLRTPRRYWEDLSVAIARYVGDSSAAPTRQLPIDSGEGADLAHSYARFVTRTVREENLKPWQFWRTITIKPFLERDGLELRAFDDPGRAKLLVLGFRVLGGVAPFLPLWIGALLCLPVLMWTCWELSNAGHVVAGAVFAVVFASSPFVVELLSLPYSGVGFYLLAILVLVPLSVFALLGRGATRGLLLRTLAAGALFAICALCRSGTLLLLPGYLLALVLGVWRIHSWTEKPVSAGVRVQTGVTLVAGVSLFLAPYALLRQPRHHEAWLGIWEGLGDFDRTKGHSFLDPAARQAVRGEGLGLPEGLTWTPQSEAILRRLVIHDILSDPGWYATILAKRVFATVFETKLWPYGPRDQMSIAPSESPNEGAADVYYKLATPVDFLGFGTHEVELPVILLVFPSLLLLVLSGCGTWVPSLEPFGGCVRVILCVVLAALVLPVFVTTASGPETQSFALVHFLALGFLLDGTGRWFRARPSQAEGGRSFLAAP
jgi:hypothetical protein